MSEVPRVSQNKAFLFVLFFVTFTDRSKSYPWVLSSNYICTRKEKLTLKIKKGLKTFPLYI